MKNQYIELIIREFLSLCQMEVVPPNEFDIKPADSFYLPHNFVTKSDSTTTKLRVVFDAFAKSTSNTSLNRNLMVGPRIQSDLLRLRFHEIVLSVCYGITSAGYHFTCSAVELAKTAPAKVHEVIENDMYVDDLLNGCSNISDARTLQNTLTAVLQQVGFPLRKWNSNQSELIERLPVDLRETKDELTFESDAYKVKALGVVWRPMPNSLNFQVKLASKTPRTKRETLSEVTKFLDLLGYLAPVLISFKCFIQNLWKIRLGWGQTLPASILDELFVLRQSLFHLINLPSIAVLYQSKKEETVRKIEVNVFIRKSLRCSRFCRHSMSKQECTFDLSLLASFRTFRCSPWYEIISKCQKSFSRYS